MSKIKTLIIKLLFKAQLGKWVAKLMESLKGYKTQVGIVIIVIIKLAIKLGYIPVDYIPLAEEVLTGIYGAITVSFGDKVRRWWRAVKETGEEVIK